MTTNATYAQAMTKSMDSWKRGVKTQDPSRLMAVVMHLRHTTGVPLAYNEVDRLMQGLIRAQEDTSTYGDAFHSFYAQLDAYLEDHVDRAPFQTPDSLAELLAA